jgi:hypothetical protein
MATRKHRYKKPRHPGLPRIRDCLRCDKPFKSVSEINKLCATCKKYVTWADWETNEVPRICFSVSEDDL